MKTKKHFLHGIAFTSLCVLVFLFSFLSYGSKDMKGLLQTTALEKYMIENYDNKGYNGYTMVIAIQQPVPGTRQIANETLDTGHAFVRLAKSGEKAWTSYFSYNVDNVTDAEETVAKVDLYKDALSEFTLAKVYKISEDGANNTLRYLWEQYKKTQSYDIAYNNCITFVVNAAKSANIPDAAHGIVARQWDVPTFIRQNPIVMYYINLKTDQYFGYSAGDAGEDLKATGGIIFAKDLAK